MSLVRINVNRYFYFIKDGNAYQPPSYGISRCGNAILMGTPAEVEKLTGKDPQPEGSLSLKSGGNYKVSWGSVEAKNPLLISINPELLKVAQVSVPSLLLPGKIDELFITISPFKGVELETFNHLLSISVLGKI